MHIVRGEAAAVRAHIQNRVAGIQQPLWFDSGSIPWSWSCVVSLLDQLRLQLAEAEIDAAITAHRPAFDLLLASPEIRSPAPGRRPFLGAHLASHLTHNWICKRPLIESLADAFLPLLEQAGATVVIPSLATIDEESQMFLRGLNRRGFHRVLVGYEPNVDNNIDDERGIRWRWSERGILRVAASLLRTPDATIDEISGIGDDPATATASVGAPPARENDCWESFSSGRPTAADLANGVHLVKARFHAFGNFSALKLGIRLLAHGDRLATADRAEVLAIVALSAHNRQFKSAGNTALGEFILESTQAALEIETRPVIRCALRYREAVTLGRRLSRLEEAEVAASRGIEKAAEAEMTELESAYQGGWGRNIRAYARMRRKNRAGSERDVRDALSMLQPYCASFECASFECASFECASFECASFECAPLEETGWKVDVESSTALFATGVSTLKFMQQELSESIEWRAVADAIEPDHPGAARFTPEARLGLHSAQYRPDLALASAEECLAGARAERDAIREYDYLLRGAALAFCVGDLGRALKFSTELRSLYSLYGRPALLASPDITLLPIYIASGALDIADEILSETQARTDLSAHQLAELHLWQARIAAQRDHREDVESHANLAIDTAVDSGRLDTLVQVASTVGDLAMGLGRPDEARDSYERALDLCRDAAKGEAWKHSISQLRALIGQAEAAGSETAGSEGPASDDAIRLAPAALRRPEGWSLLPRLLRWLAEDRRQSAQTEGSELEPERRLLHSAAQLRDDCRPYLGPVFGAARPSLERPRITDPPSRRQTPLGSSGRNIAKR